MSKDRAWSAGYGSAGGQPERRTPPKGHSLSAATRLSTSLRHHAFWQDRCPLAQCVKLRGVGGRPPSGGGLSGVRLLRLLASLPGALARTVELQDDGVVHQAVDGGHRGHRILEDLVPLAEDQI